MKAKRNPPPPPWAHQSFRRTPQGLRAWELPPAEGSRGDITSTPSTGWFVTWQSPLLRVSLSWCHEFKDGLASVPRTRHSGSLSKDRTHVPSSEGPRQLQPGGACQLETSDTPGNQTARAPRFGWGLGESIPCSSTQQGLSGPWCWRQVGVGRGEAKDSGQSRFFGESTIRSGI